MEKLKGLKILWKRKLRAGSSPAPGITILPIEP